MFDLYTQVWLIYKKKKIRLTQLSFIIILILIKKICEHSYENICVSINFKLFNVVLLVNSNNYLIVFYELFYILKYKSM